MNSQMLLLCMLLLLSVSGAFSMQFRGRSRPGRVSMSIQTDMMKNIAGALLISTLSTSILPSQSMAAVGEGDLPPGVVAFSKLIRYQKDWDKVAENVKAHRNDFTDREVLDLKVFFKQLGNEYLDMDLLSKSIVDKTKAQQAIDLSKEFKKLLRECDKAASDRDFDKVLQLYTTTSDMLKNYLALLQDVPDEL